MVTDDQSEVIAFLRAPATHGGLPVTSIDTHASIVFLVGTRALKLKRAVRYDYLDYSTVERRRLMCEAEARLNRTAAPDLYRGVVAVTREPDRSLAVGGTGQPVEWLLEMARFDQDGLFDQLAAHGQLSVDVMPALAATIARFHAAAERRADHGGARAMRWVIDGNAAAFADDGDHVVDPGPGLHLLTRSRDAVTRHGRLLDARRDAGLVRRCHGDLHLRNIVMLQQRPTLFDAVEFNDEITCTDVLYDIAFLVMDLWHRQLPRHANVILNEYLSRTGDMGGVALLPLFLSCRAAVRAKTAISAAMLQRDPEAARDLRAAARQYFSLAERVLDPAPRGLVAVGGYSGSGKSTLAMALAPSLGAVPGAVVMRSDVARKRLHGLDPHDRLGPEGYTADADRQVYADVVDRALEVAAGGHAAIVDAVYARAADREAIERAAMAAGIPFVGLWLDAPAAVLTTRVEGRSGDASDADAAVVRAQMARNAGLVTWHRLDAAKGAAEVEQAARDVLQARLGGAVASSPRP